jgi:hypothetical protein
MSPVEDAAQSSNGLHADFSGQVPMIFRPEPHHLYIGEPQCTPEKPHVRLDSAADEKWGRLCESRWQWSALFGAPEPV